MRLIDADEIHYDKLLKTGNKEHPLEWAISHSQIDNMPTIDAAPVVRCKDCKHLFTDFVMDGKEYKRCELQMAGFHDDWYCADGERKD